MRQSSRPQLELYTQPFGKWASLSIREQQIFARNSVRLVYLRNSASTSNTFQHGDGEVE